MIPVSTWLERNLEPGRTARTTAVIEQGRTRP